MRAFILAAFLALGAAPAAGESPQEAQKWVEQLRTLTERGPFEVDYTAEIDMSGLGQQMTGTLEGHITLADRTHTRIELTMTSTGTPGLDGEEVTRMLSVTDGTTVWAELESPEVDELQILKISLDALAELEGADLTGSPASLDPILQLQAMTETMDFRLVEARGGRVRLEGTVTEATRKQVGVLADAADVETFEFVLDEGNGFPVEVRAGGEKPFVVMRFRNLKRVESLAPELFQYTPPNGVEVVDLGEL